MTVTGYYEKENANGEVKRFRNINFESTGVKFENGKVIWRKLKKRWYSYKYLCSTVCS